ncbi:MAG TPA: hypothetical protein VL096_00675, partial [Pirellulaceae bacterium]|nr:hypothetical protein [Pirellulaceae bacterium]
RVLHAQARGPFEYEAYRVKLWVAVEPSPLVAPTAASELATALTARTDLVFGAAWQVRGVAAPASLSQRILAGKLPLSSEEIAAVSAATLDEDKLIIIGVREADGVCRVVAQEFDCRSRSWSEPTERVALQPDNLVEAALSAVVEAFSPVVRIELVEGEKAQTRLRAGGLLTSDESPAALKAGQILQPVLRRNDRYGEAGKNSIQRLPFTFLQVSQRDGYRVSCDIHSGVRGAIGGRGARTEKFALLVRPQERGTRLTLRKRGPSASELVGYEVLTRKINSPAPPVLLGQSNLRGAIQIPLATEPIEFIYVRHGQQMLARVPVVPGLLPEQTISLTDDDPRLAAEGYFVAMQNSVMDLVARREVLAARIRARAEQNQWKEAKEMVPQLRALPSRAELLRQVELQQQRFRSDDKAVQAKVDKMFVELRKLLGKHLDPRLIDEVAAEISAGKQ